MMTRIFFDKQVTPNLVTTETKSSVKGHRYSPVFSTSRWEDFYLLDELYYKYKQDEIKAWGSPCLFTNLSFHDFARLLQFESRGSSYGRLSCYSDTCKCFSEYGRYMNRSRTIASHYAHMPSSLYYDSLWKWQSDHRVQLNVLWTRLYMYYQAFKANKTTIDNKSSTTSFKDLMTFETQVVLETHKPQGNTTSSNSAINEDDDDDDDDSTHDNVSGQVTDSLTYILPKSNMVKHCIPFSHFTAEAWLLSDRTCITSCSGTLSVPIQD